MGPMHQLTILVVDTEVVHSVGFGKARVVPVLGHPIVDLLADGLDVKADPHHGVVVEDPAPVEDERRLLH